MKKRAPFTVWMECVVAQTIDVQPKSRQPAPGRAYPLCKAVITSSNLSAIACISAWAGGLETVKSSYCTWAWVSKRFWMAWNWPCISPDSSGDLSAGKLGSRIGVDISNV